MADFDSCVAYVLKHEGGLSEDAADPGGITSMGISLRFLRDVNTDTLKRVGIFGDVTAQTIRDLTLDQAQKLYFFEFWSTCPVEKIQNGIIAKYCFDMMVNHGQVQAIKLIQRACCAAQKVKDYVKDDGIMGSKTLQAINQASFMLIPALIATRAAFMRQLVASNSKLECFIDGWLNRVFDVQY
ncbi:zliS Lysozyme family protein [uncultured Caudovirales phage]|uniref:ZliS Lysozyme family protein n=1 Tax=uncultured Caudovirales phage TaxID=2100421 RepID=A0A6J5LI14_9CAUD|nr:zliS Lysozyme family protein [uncultured Caudovirales phage]CAB4134238.1 zliS Lysozyme family protein [uncultured Caudovirales phage]